MNTNNAILKIMLCKLLYKIGGNKIGKRITNEIYKICARKSADSIADISSYNNNEIMILLNKFSDIYGKEVEEHKLKEKIKELWFNAFSKKLILSKSLLERLIRCIKFKQSMNITSKVIDDIYNSADADFFISSPTPSEVNIISLKHKVGIKYYLDMKKDYYSILINKKLYMIVHNSKEMYIGHLPELIKIKVCKITQAASRKFEQGFSFPLAIGSKYIVCIGYGKALHCQIYTIHNDSWSAMPDVPIANKFDIFTVWSFDERFVYVFLDKKHLFYIDLYDTESNWTSMKIEANNNDKKQLENTFGLNKGSFFYGKIGRKCFNVPTNKVDSSLKSPTKSFDYESY